MKTFSAVVLGLAIVLSARVAPAYVVQVVTTASLMDATSGEAKSRLGDAVQAAIRDVLEHAIAFTPTVVRIEDARIIGERLYLVLLIADADGEATLEGLGTDHTRSDAPDVESPGPPDGGSPDAPDVKLEGGSVSA
jgi:hypothetical protein